MAHGGPITSVLYNSGRWTLYSQEGEISKMKTRERKMRHERGILGAEMGLSHIAVCSKPAAGELSN